MRTFCSDIDHKAVNAKLKKFTGSSFSVDFTLFLILFDLAICYSDAGPHFAIFALFAQSVPERVIVEELARRVLQLHKI